MTPLPESYLLFTKEPQVSVMQLSPTTSQLVQHWQSKGIHQEQTREKKKFSQGLYHLQTESILPTCQVKGQLCKLL